MIPGRTPFYAPVVHVHDVTANVCRPAIVLAMPYWSDDPIRARVIRPSVLGVAQEDDEGSFQPSSNPGSAMSPDGKLRLLDHWHPAIDCPGSE